MNNINSKQSGNPMECLHYFHSYYYSYWRLFFFFFFTLMMTSSPFSSSSFPSDSNNIVKNHTCLHDQSLALLQFKASFDIHFTAFHSRVLSWNANTDCCSSWEGVTCNSKGNVIGLDVSNGGLSGFLHFNSSLFNLHHLAHLNLSSCNFSGPVPSSFSNLSHHLVKLDMSHNNFTGMLPSLNSFSKTSITFIGLSFNRFTGPIPASYVDGRLPNLQMLDLSRNLLTGTIPSLLFTELPSLEILRLSSNLLHGELEEFIYSPTLSSQLREIDLSHNLLEGRIPTSFSQLSSLKLFLLSSNKFYGALDPRIFENKQNLTVVDLSYNRLLSIKASDVVFSLPNMFRFSFSSCNLTEFPTFLKHQEIPMRILDLSDNQIQGRMPEWSWTKSAILNLSHNSIVDFEQPNLSADIISSINLRTLDLRSNMLKGLNIPILPKTLFFVLLSNNNLVDVPMSICNSSNLRILDLSNNQISGSIPLCLANLTKLNILDLSQNKFCGNIPHSLGNLSDIRALNFNRNLLEGPVPRSLDDCERLEVLDLGNNQINDVFPSWLESLERLQVLILQSNRFHGPIVHNIPRLINVTSFPLLHIIDISSNNFTGHLPLDYFRSSKGMTMINESNWYKIQSSFSADVYYRYSLIVASKGLELSYEYKLLYILNIVDLSRNKFEGEIPESIGDFKSVSVLNLSHNSLTGKIPLSLGNLTELQSLDLSSNNLLGEIPSELTKLTFLSVLNLSWNHLVGRIPSGAQFNTFTSHSFEGNLGLCGFPLQIECHHHHQEDSTNSPSSSETTFDWIFALAGLASGIVIGVLVEHFVLPKTTRYHAMFLKIERFVQDRSSRRRIRH